MTESRENGLSQDTLFSLLSNQRRRFILQYLNRTGETIQLQDLATEVAAWENETEPEKLTDKQRKRLYVSLYQTHIPRLEEAGIIDYDRETGEIRLKNRDNDLDRYLDTDAPESDDTRPWGQYYLPITLLAVLVYGLIAVSGGPLSRIEAVLIGVGWIPLAGLAAFHYIKTERWDGN
jgi:DNA-binding transcriptional ArsR family regulator